MRTYEVLLHIKNKSHRYLNSETKTRQWSKDLERIIVNRDGVRVPFGGGFALSILPWLCDLWVTAEELSMKPAWDRRSKGVLLGQNKKKLLKKLTYSQICSLKELLAFLPFISSFLSNSLLCGYDWNIHGIWKADLQNHRSFDLAITHKHFFCKRMP